MELTFVHVNLMHVFIDNPTLRESSLLNYNIVNDTKGRVGGKRPILSIALKYS